VSDLLGGQVQVYFGSFSLVIEHIRAGKLRGNIATEAVVRAPADGYTLLGTDAAAAINATLYDNLNFNFVRDIAAVAIIQGPLLVTVHPSVPAKTIPEFIAYAKANPGKVGMASAGSGSPPHLAGGLERTHECTGGKNFDLDTPAGRDADCLRKTNRAGVQARETVRPVGHHLQLPDALCNRRRGKGRGRPGGQRSRANQNIPPPHSCSTFLQCTFIIWGWPAKVPSVTGKCAERNWRSVRQCAPHKSRAAYVRIGSNHDLASWAAMSASSGCGRTAVPTIRPQRSVRPHCHFRKRG
jgi:hypothetical protein